MPVLAGVARILNLIAGHKLLAVAHAEPSLSFNGANYERPVEFNLDPFFAEVGAAYWFDWTPSAACNIQVQSVQRGFRNRAFVG